MSVRLPESYDIESDVVVVGYGAAGAAAAITAHDNGASVLVLEKMPSSGGNSRVCGGFCLIPKSMEGAAKFGEYLKTLSYETTDPEIIDIFVREAMKHKDWVKEMGGELVVPAAIIMADTYPKILPGPGFPSVSGGKDTFDKYCVGGEAEVPPSIRLWDFLSGNVERREIKVMTSTPAKELIKNEEGEIVGVIAETEGKSISIKAKKAVILTCGGYENDSALKWDYLPAKPVKFIGNPGNTGDGIRMVQKIGGDIWHMTRLSCAIAFQAPEYEAGFGIFFSAEGFIYVDKHGRRFGDESQIEIHEFYRIFSYFDTEAIEFPRIPSWGIFNEETRRRGPLTWGMSGYNRDLYKWSPDNSAEVRKGWIIKAKSIAELAKQMSVDESTLENTITKYNEYCKVGKDPDFGRAKENMLPIEAPYYAIQLWPALLNSQGGPRRDKEARILDPDGKPIPRLYSAGELGSIWGYLYQGSCNISECFVFGRIAGRNAAAEKAWS